MPDSEEEIRTEASPWEAKTLLMPERVDDAEEMAKPLSNLTVGERYEHEQVLGEGGMGVVKLERDAQIGRKVAVKILREEYAGRPEIESRFVREARLQGQLEHPAVLPVYDLGIDEQGATYFTMKRVRGVDLATIISRLAAGDEDFVAAYPRRRLLTAFAAICLAVDFAHRRGVVHRDIKPDNIMLGDFGEVYILDWGLAKLDKDERTMPATMLDVHSMPDAKTMAGDIMGTPGFMAPEHVSEGANAVTPAADVYALGCVLFELLTLEPLHPTGPLSATFASTIKGCDARPSKRAPNQQIPPELDGICVRATARSPDERYESARALHEELERFLGGERDVERRREAAKEHAAKAAEAVQQRGAGGAAEIDARRNAMREIGKALAFDPTNQEAQLYLARLLTEPPESTPPEVARDLDRSERAKTRWIARFGTLVYASMFLYLPLLWWVGIRNPVPIVLMYVGVAGICTLSGLASLTRRPSPWIPFFVMVISNFSFALTATFFGPLVLTPGIIAVNTSAFALHGHGRFRYGIIVVGTLSLLIPIALELTGVTANYSFTAAGMTIVPTALEMPKTPVLVLLSLTTLGGLITGCLSGANIRDQLDAAEQNLLLYAWHLRQFAPDTARKMADPTETLKTWDDRRRSRGPSLS
ncbi:MAG: serine/threonine protein kinase [Deltaproteobacteria bacterium]|jgi:serine/threonine-protein kinase|nr:serine/threonine protein kinase [Deltaproteobacteria bacterium]MBW2535767.1 serine/threonine protein kinase [Deltaproteobacteria bacterium]